MQGKLALAISNYHKALGLRTDDTFASEMLAAALQEECKQLENEPSDDLMLELS